MIEFNLSVFYFILSQHVAQSAIVFSHLKLIDTDIENMNVSGEMSTAEMKTLPRPQNSDIRKTVK